MSDVTEALKRSAIYKELLAEYAKKPQLRLVVTNPETYKMIRRPL